ncbi:MAG: primosomal protein N' [Lentisphaerae bacterium]|nr:primosomal protein N' [Lentisphaerota bacterium]
MRIAEVVFNLSLDKGFDYLIPAHLSAQLQVGNRVLAPFRTGTRSGYVIRLKNHSSVQKLKTIISLEDEKRQIPPALLTLAAWISDYYCCPRENAVWAMLPAVVRKGEMAHKQIFYLTLTPKAAAFDAQFEALSKKQQDVIRILHRVGALPLKELLGLVEAGERSINRLCAEGWLLKEKRVVERDPFRDTIIQPDQPKTLNQEQAHALDQIKLSLDRQDASTFLLHGVTASGKTEVYLQAIQHCLDLQREAIVLVPEISLTPQTCDRFRQRYGNRVSVLHSGLSDGERFDEWNRINDGRSQIAVGARSALFAPFRQLGLIVVDEEHENSYKQEDSPRYNARDVAVVRGKLEKATVLMGSATPSLETYHNCRTNRYKLLTLRERIADRPLPVVELVDMSQERVMTGQSSIFSRRLKDQINDRLHCGEQVMLFLNRRGFASQMLCSKCGYAATCTNCSVAYTYHRKEAQLLCHLCGAQMPAPQKCPGCNDPEIRYTGFGTEKIEAVTRALFPTALVARMDSDTMTSKDSYRKILDAFRSQRINILIGTQMIAKGLDFPNVTLVGLLQADQGLNLPDFRSGERTFQLITQVAGRAGRGEQPGLVVVQTYTPYHFALQAACKQDYVAFYEAEIPGREALDFPPFSRMIMVHFRGREESQVSETALAFAEKLQPLLKADVQAIGPLPAPLSKINTYFRYQLLLRGRDVRAMSAALRSLLPVYKHRKCDIYLDVDPRSLL